MGLVLSTCVLRWFRMKSTPCCRDGGIFNIAVLIVDKVLDDRSSRLDARQHASDRDDMLLASDRDQWPIDLISATRFEAVFTSLTQECGSGTLA